MLPEKNKFYSTLITGLGRIGYYEELLQEDYKFNDWFASGREERSVAAAAFAQTPVAYDSACIGVVFANGLRESALVDQYRSLGAPVILEIDSSEIREWAVSGKEGGHALVERYPIERVNDMIANRAQEWKPEPFLRAKNIGSFHWSKQLGLFAGLLPELEHRIQEKLEPVLYDALTATKAVYRSTTGQEPSAAHLFKLIFSLLTAKVFHDRRVSGFKLLGPDADELLNAISNQYKEGIPQLLNKDARQVAASLIWTELDFRNLSVEVLSQMWSSMLVDAETKKKLGIHRTSRTLVRYIVERIPFEQSGDDRRIILEPCSGSAVFLIGVMNVLRQQHRLFGMDPSERHKYFVKHLAAIEKDAFGVEISRLALTLADFPNPGGWNIAPRDVFEQGALTPYLQQAAVVLCNPPFGDFDSAQKRRYQAKSPKQPVELLNRVLSDLHPAGVLGFVLPRNLVDGRGGYAEIRRLLVRRFASMEVTVLPDRAFEGADSEVALLVATDPTPHKASKVRYRKVYDNEEAWRSFAFRHEVSTEHSVEISTEDEKKKLPRTFAAPELADVWDFLSTYPRMQDMAVLHRGIEWRWRLTMPGGVETGHRRKLVRSTTQEGFARGIAPRTKFRMFEMPRTHYLSLRPEDERGNSFDRAWNEPKVILNKSARSRGNWRVAAFPDTEGLVFYQTYIGVWPTSSRYDVWLISAILNSPVANAFISTREGKTDITKETLNLIPMPHFTEKQRAELIRLVKHYQQIESFPILTQSDDPVRVLMEIDALVLKGYRMPPRLERSLLDFFKGQSRPTRPSFQEYPERQNVYLSLSEYLSPKFKAVVSVASLKPIS